jgi:hypothetical protein
MSRTGGNAGTQQELVLIVPILKGRVGDVKRLAAALSSSKSREFEESQKTLGIEKESWFLSGSGDYVIVHIEGKDVSKSVSDLISSKTPFDLWIKNEVMKVTGVDWNNPPTTPVPQQILRYGY